MTALPSYVVAVPQSALSSSRARAAVVSRTSASARCTLMKPARSTTRTGWRVLRNIQSVRSTTSAVNT